MSGEVLISLAGIIVGLILMIWLIMRGVNIFLIAFLCSTIVALTGQLPLYEALKETYMAGFVGFLKSNWLMFLTGTLLGKAMEVTNGAKSIARVLVGFLGKDKALLSIPISCGILAYGGVSAFVCSFAVFPIALQVFHEADLPRRYIPAALTFGCSTFAMVAPGAVQIHNTIPANALGTTIMAGAVNGFLSCGFMLIVGCIVLYVMVKKEKEKGAHFVAKPMDVFTEDEELPPAILAFIPLVVTILSINTGLVPVEAGVFLGAALTIILLFKHQDSSKLVYNTGEAAKTSIVSITNTCAVVAFGAVVQASVAFPAVIEAMINIPGPPLLGVAIGTTGIAGICGSASGGLGIAAPALGPTYIAQGVSAATIHRVMAIGSSALDSLPHNGYIVTVTNGLCNETHKDAYGPVGILTVLIPGIATVVAVILFTLFPNFP